MTISPETITSILGGSGAVLLFTAWARHIPDWPLTWAKVWEWFRGTVQEVASQRSGQIPTQPETPAQPK